MFSLQLFDALWPEWGQSWNILHKSDQTKKKEINKLSD